MAGTYAFVAPQSVDQTFTVLFTMDLLLRLAASSQRITFLCSPMAIVDILTVTPVYLEWLGDMDNGNSLNFLRFIRVLRVMRILRTFKVINNGMNAIKRQTITLALTVTSIVFLAAGLVHLFEGDLFQPLEGTAQDEHMTFGNALWFIIVTLSTVGFGDVVPESRFGQVVTAIFIIASIVLIPMQVNQLTGLLALQSKFRTKHRPSNGTPPHVLIIGHVSDASMLEDFLAEFYHPDRVGEGGGLDNSRQAIIMGPDEPTDGVQSLLLNPVYDTHIRYVRGSVMSNDDLWRVAADKAEACFVLCNSGASDPAAEDKATALRTLVVKNFNPALRIFVHILGGRALQHVQQSEVDEAVAVEEWKTRLLAQSTLVPGFSTLVNNIMRSATVPDLDQLEPWMREYSCGAGLEIYPVPVPQVFKGLTFTEVVRIVYSRFDGTAIVWGVQEPAARRSSPLALERIERIQRRARRGSGPSSQLLSCSPFSNSDIPGKVHLNPGKRYRVTSGMTLFVLAEDESIALDVARNSSYASTDLPTATDGPPGFDPEQEGDRKPGCSWCDVRKPSKQRQRGVTEDGAPSEASGWSRLRQHLKQRAKAQRVRERATDTDVGRTGQMRSVVEAFNKASVHRLAAPAPPDPYSALAGVITEDVRGLEESDGPHILVIGSLPSFTAFLKPLRARHLNGTSLFKPVVLLTEDKDESKLAHFSEHAVSLSKVHIVFGQAHSLSDLRRAGISSASCAVIASNRDHSSPIDGIPLDASVLFSYMVLEQALLSVPTLPDFYTLVELSTMDNLQILNRKRLSRMQVLDFNGDKAEQVHRLLGVVPPAAAAPEQQRGSAATLQLGPGIPPQQRESAKRQAFSLVDAPITREEEGLQRVEELKRRKRQQERQQSRVHFSGFNSGATMPFFAAGYGYATDTLHTMLCQAFYCHETMRFADELLSPDPGRASRLICRPVPNTYHSLSFGVLFFDCLMQHDAVCVGLYRCRSALGSDLCYVVTGPDPDVKLHSTSSDRDLMYLLSTNPPPPSRDMKPAMLKTTAFTRISAELGFPDTRGGEPAGVAMAAQRHDVDAVSDDRRGGHQAEGCEPPQRESKLASAARTERIPEPHSPQAASRGMAREGSEPRKSCKTVLPKLPDDFPPSAAAPLPTKSSPLRRGVKAKLALLRAPAQAHQVTRSPKSGSQD